MKSLYACVITDNWPQCPGTIIKYFSTREKAQLFGESEISAAKELKMEPLPTFEVIYKQPA
jgi:hypothetical protein